MTKRKHRTPEQWEIIYQDWQASGLSQPKYCQQINIPTQSLYNYTRRRSPNQTLPEPKQSTQPAFVEVGSLTSTDLVTPIEIVLDIGQNIQLRIRQSA